MYPYVPFVLIRMFYKKNLVRFHPFFIFQYFENKFTCPMEANSTCVGFEKTFENYFSVAAMIPISLMTAVNIWLQSK